MALLELYMQTTGDDRNAGTDNGANPTEITGTVSTASGLTTFTASSGTPFSGVSAGAWVSLYNSGETISRFSGQVQSVTSSTVIVVYNQAASSPNNTALGTVASLTGTVACRIGGAWKSFAITGTGGVLNAPASSAALTGGQYNSLRVNIQAGTYTYSTAITLPGGLAAKPIWWRGYYATIGDIDNCAKVGSTLTSPAPTGATRPQITSTATTLPFTVSPWTWLENLEFAGVPAANNGVLQLTSTAGLVRMVRCRVTANSGAVNASVINIPNANPTLQLVGCLIVNNSTSTAITNWYGTVSAIGCVFRGVGTTYGLIVAGPTTLAFCIIEGPSTSSMSGIIVASPSTSCTFLNNVIYNCQYGLNLQAGLSTHILAANNLISNVGTGVSQNGTANAWTTLLMNTGFYSVSGAQAAGLWESYQKTVITETAGTPPLVSPGSPNYDYTLASTALARQAGFPGQFEV